MATKEPLSDTELANLEAQLLGIRTEKDRLKLLKTAAAESTLTCQQAIRLIATVKYGQSLVDAAVICHPRLSDPENFAEVLAILPYDEDRLAVKQQLRLA